MAGLRIMGMGDSIMREGPPGRPIGVRRQTWYERLNAAGWVFDLVGRLQFGDFPDNDNEGWNGFSVDQLDALLEDALTVNPADLIYFQAGTNDAVRDVVDASSRLDTFLHHLAAFSWQTRVIVSSIPLLDPSQPLGVVDAQVAFNAAIPGIVAAHRALGQHVHYTNAGGSLTLSDLDDGVHPSVPTGSAKLGNLDADAILALYTVTAPTLAGRIATHVGVAGVDTYRVTIGPIGTGNTIKAVRFGERFNLESVLSLQLDNLTFSDGSIAFTIQRISPLDASLELTITDGGGDWDTQVAMAAGPD